MIADTPAAHVLLVDDDIELTAMLTDYLEAEGFRVEAVFDGEAGVAAALSGSYDALILDVMLPRLSGIEALRQIRRTSMIPIIMLTARGDDIDRVVGLELGADDYVPKPYFPRELVARLRAVLRRRPAEPVGAPVDTTQQHLGRLVVDTAARRALYGEHMLDLTACEFNLMSALLRAGDRVASKDNLSLEVLGRPRESYDRSIDVHVSNLRHKIAEVAGGAIEIETIRGIGYRMREAR